MSVRLRRRAALAFLIVLLLAGWRSWGRSFGLFGPTRPAADLLNLRYGPHERNVLDIWKAKPLPRRAGPTPLVVFFHGGGFRNGDKSIVPAWLLRDCLDEGISVASANYRLSQTAAFPGPMLDGARVIQYLRANAAELGIDPDRIAASGSSAGAGIALWVGFHDDLVDPRSDDPVARQSSRVCCLGVDGAQTSYDPRFIKTLIGGRAYEHSALRAFFGINSDAEMDLPRIHKLFEDASPINHVTSDDPPVMQFYAERDAPLPSDAKPGQGIHHPRFGKALKSKLDGLGVECTSHHWANYAIQNDPVELMYREMTRFFGEQFERARSAGR
jgi:acetyl esterase/lipase